MKFSKIATVLRAKGRISQCIHNYWNSGTPPVTTILMDDNYPYIQPLEGGDGADKENNVVLAGAVTVDPEDIPEIPFARCKKNELALKM